MIELAVFLLFQIIINLLVKRFFNGYRQYVFRSLAILAFSLLMLAYPFMLISFYFNNFYSEGKTRCGNAYIGMVAFLWVIGTPLVLLFQYLLNRFLFKSNPTIEKSK
jgi:hypothetical protein